jgi:DNA repair exonuclease SbcCD ATPase subunit
MHLKSLRLQNFRSFSDSAIEFPEKGLVLVRGKDVDTNESSGAGKTTLMLGLAYALDILPTGFSAKSLQSWNTEEPLQVTLTLEHEGKLVVLSRGKKTSIDFGDRVVQGAKSYPEALQSLVGYGPEILRALTYRNQGASGFFLAQSPSGKVEFLTGVLGLGAIETAIQTSHERAKVLESETATKQALVDALRTRLLAATEEAIPPEVNLDPLELDVVQTQTARQTLTTAIANLEKQIADLKAQQRKSKQSDIDAKSAALEKARTFLGKLRAEDNSKLKEVRAAESVARQSLQRVTSALQRLQQQATEIVRLQKERARLAVGMCPTCEREWDQAAERRQSIDEKIASLQVEAQGEAVYRKQKQELETQLSESSTWTPNPKIEQLRQIEIQLTEELRILERTSETPVKLATQLEASRAMLRDSDAKYHTANTALQVAKAQASSRAASIKRRDAAIELASKDLLAAESKLGTLTAELNAERDFESLLGRSGFLGLIFEEVLREIAAEANARMGKLANVNRVGLTFTTETEKGRRQIQTWVDIRGNRTKLEVGPSGGMQTSIHQVVDLAVMTVIGRRTGGKVPGWLCLDEIFEGQGGVTKEAALEVLQEFARDRLVLVIDHGTEMQQLFTKVIDIEFRDGVSSVT